MKIISYNINGLRSFISKNVLDDMIEMYALDVLAFQETRCPSSYIDDVLIKHFPYFKILDSKTRKGL
jgi:exonuclease III